MIRQPAGSSRMPLPQTRKVLQKCHFLRASYTFTNEVATTIEMQTTVIVDFGSQKYALGPWIHSISFAQESSSNRVSPAVVLSVRNGGLNSRAIYAKISEFQHLDDVYSHAFLTDTVVLQTTKLSTICLKTAASILRDCGEKLGVKWNPVKILMLQSPPLKEIPDGPYFIHGQGIFEAWKVFSVLNAVSSDGNWKGVAVPSRLYDKPSPQRPLAGKRISIKDNMKLSGIATTLSSQSFLDTYGTDTKNAAYISRLIKLGAVIVGKTKMTAFASGEKPPDDWIDFRCPRNPRGDRYLQPTGSSTGAAASLAAYEWLDFSIGTDTTGSIRFPAVFCGLFGIRLSMNIAAPFEGVYPNSPYFDAVGLLSRDLQSLLYLAKSSLNKDIKDYCRFPKSILYFTDFVSSDPAEETIMAKFMNILENFLDVKTTKLCLAELWSKLPPPEANGKPLLEFVKTTIDNINRYDCYHEYDGYREDHQIKFGYPPYISPFMKWKWGRGENFPLSGKEQSVKEMEIFKSWFKNNVLQEDEETGSTAIVVLPCAMTKSMYRDVVPAESHDISEWLASMDLATVTGMPQVVLPVAQTAYLSKVTERTEYLPCTVSIAGASGSDLMLLKLANGALEKAGWPTKVLTGARTFLLGDNNRNVGVKDSCEDLEDCMTVNDSEMVRNPGLVRKHNWKEVKDQVPGGRRCVRAQPQGQVVRDVIITDLLGSQYLGYM
ncbi:uncharacterized protein PAC_08527 [Phialocephala subalpina]|uniref:Uncharacterized protein n=1 Tax=Phialocephala subalpina TaxID=576137 RepID=A0A1L7X0U2_9HELO|nr:uncharacterized protein PAC_08527 [Phialocephala subalpina]